MAEREAVTLGSFQAQRSTSMAQTSVQPARDGGVNTSGAQIMGALNQFAGQLNEVAQMEVQKTISEDKIKQSAIAAQDTYRTEAERQGLTKDATVAGRQAYNAIVGQHDVLEANNRLVQLKQDSPDMSDEDFKKAQQKEYDGLIKTYGVDKWTLGNLTETIAQSQAPLVRVTEGITSEYRGEKRKEALSISVQDMLGDPAADINHIVQKEIPARAAMMGVSEFAMKKMLMSTAVERADNGDIRLIDELERTDWSKGSALLTTGRERYQQWRAKEMAPIIGDRMGSIEMKALNGEQGWGATMKQMEGMNKEFPGTYSASAFASMKVRMDSAAKQRAKEAVMLTQASEAVYNQNVLPLGLDNSRSEADKNKIVKQQDSWLAEKNRELIQQGKSAEEANALTLDYGMKWSRANRVALPLVKGNLETAITYNPDDYKGKEVPSYVQDSLRTLKKLDTATMGLYLNEGDATFARNFQYFSQNMTDDAAFRRAKQVRDNPVVISKEQRTAQTEKLSAVIDDKLTHNGLAQLVGWTKERDVPEWQRNNLKSQLEADAAKRLYLGGSDPEANAKYTVESAMAQRTQTFNGTLVNIPAGKLVQNLAPVDPATGRPTGKVTYEQANKAMEAYTLTLMPRLREESGKPKLKEDEITFDFNSDGSMFRIIDKDGEQIGGNHLTHEAGEVGRQSSIKHLRQVLEVGKKKAEENREDATQELFRQINGGPLFEGGRNPLDDLRT